MKPHAYRRVGYSLIFTSLVILAVLGVYAAYVAYERSHLDELNFDPDALDQSSTVWSARLVNGAEKEQHFDDQEVASLTSQEQAESTGSVILASASGLVDRYARMYPGANLHPKYWHEPLRAGTDVRLETGLPDGFEAASADDYRRFAEPKADAMKLSIPSLGIESAVMELSILDLGDSREYETPDNMVGHIPDTADPGELGNGWFFGHLESPLRGEGNVFHRLPEIPMLLRHFSEIGEGALYVLLESATGIYLYEVVATNVMHASDLRLYDTDGVYITLVTCVPRLDYSHRLLVTAKLVGVRT